MDFERQRFFWSRVQNDGDHLIWTGSQTPRGYGKMSVDGRLEYVHRIAYCIAKNFASLSEINDLTIVKICERNDCCAPEHLIARPKKPGSQRRGRKANPDK